MKLNIKELILSLILVVVSPIIFILVFNIGIFTSGKANSKNIEQTTTKDTSENSKTSSNEEKKVNNMPSSTDLAGNNSTNSSNNTSEKIQNNDKKENDSALVAGTQYTVKSGDTIMSIAARAYGDSNAGDGVEKIKKENDLKNDNLSVGQTLKIPK